MFGKIDPQGGKRLLYDDSCVRMMAFWKVCEERFYDLGDLLQSSFTSVCSGHKREKAIGDTFKINCPFIRKTFVLFAFLSVMSQPPFFQRALFIIIISLHTKPNFIKEYS